MISSVAAVDGEAEDFLGVGPLLEAGASQEEEDPQVGEARVVGGNPQEVHR